jgi:hypothetical protein
MGGAAGVRAAGAALSGGSGWFSGAGGAVRVEPRTDMPGVEVGVVHVQRRPRRGEGDRAAELGGVGDRSARDSVRASGFSASYEQFDALIGFLDGADTVGFSHAELEERLDRDGRELRCGGFSMITSRCGQRASGASMR